ncbi:RNA-guided endonuclease InsQ/TnpB family protein [Microseira sp. BLCC-F43]|uniref:RNA-guided endonuclease InsQ/TnpB family protein n=1 Tax=Microseira sp. BLCC-F43 TaxID=3153602 RepID=UPI0035BA650B
MNDRIVQYSQQFILGDYCDIKTRVLACPLTCFVSKNGASLAPGKDTLVDQEGNAKNPRRSAGDIQITALPQLKLARPWYGEIDSTVLQQNVKRLDVAYKNFFEGQGFPKFKTRSNFTSFTYATGVKIKASNVYFPKLGWMRFHNSRPVPDGFTIKSVTVRQRQDGWYISVRIEDKTIPDYAAKPLGEVKSLLGGDLGITKLVHLSVINLKIPSLLPEKRQNISLKLDNAESVACVKGSKKRKKADKKVGRLHKKIADKRQARSVVGGEDYYLSTSRCHRDRRFKRRGNVAPMPSQKGRYKWEVFTKWTIKEKGIKPRYKRCRIE